MQWVVALGIWETRCMHPLALCLGERPRSSHVAVTPGRRCHFTAHDYMDMGEALCRGVQMLAEADDASLLRAMAAEIRLS